MSKTEKEMENITNGLLFCPVVYYMYTCLCIYNSLLSVYFIIPAACRVQHLSLEVSVVYLGIFNG